MHTIQEAVLEAAELKMLRFSLGLFEDRYRAARLRWFAHLQSREVNISNER